MSNTGFFKASSSPRFRTGGAFKALWLDQAGASMTEYLVVTGFCAFLGITAFHNFGRTLNRSLDTEAEHVQGRGQPSAGDLLDAVTDLPDMVCTPLPSCLADLQTNASPASAGPPANGNPTAQSPGTASSNLPSGAGLSGSDASGDDDGADPTDASAQVGDPFSPP